MMIFVYPLYYAANPPEAYAAVASKVAGQAAKQIAKEVIQDQAITMAANYALMEAMEIADKYQTKEGYKAVCPNGGKTCDKPIQVKTNLTDSDKQAIKGQAGIELDKAITGGKGMTKWQKFMDWFLPVWLTTFAATAITYAIDPEARSLFNEVGYNALVALGFIIPITTKEPVPVSTSEPEIDGEGNYKDSAGFNQPLLQNNLSRPPGTSTGVQTSQSFSPSLTMQNTLIVQTISGLNGDLNRVWVENQVGYKIFGFNNGNIYVGSGDALGTNVTAVMQLNGQTLFDGVPQTRTTGDVSISILGTDIYPLLKKTRAIMYRTPYEINGFWYTDILFQTPEGAIDLQVKSDRYTPRLTSQYKIATAYVSDTAFTIKTVTYKNQEPFKRIMPSSYEEFEQEGNTIPKGNYEDENGNVALIPPAAIDFEEEGTGERVYRVPASTGEGYTFEKADGTPVPEENVQVPPNWQPNVQPSPTPIPNPGGNPDPYPQGTPTVTPSPTPSNPAPEPIPLTPTPTPTPNPDPNTPPTDPNAPPAKEPVFPEGESCEEGLKFPRLSPFLSAMENNFPLSIPFDIRNAFNAAFGEIGDKKPEWTFKLRDAEFKIAPPAFFDTFKPFTDSLLRFIFSIGMIYAIMRIMKGMN